MAALRNLLPDGVSACVTAGREGVSCLRSATALAMAISALLVAPMPAEAQFSGNQFIAAAEADPNSPMLLEADELIYNDADGSVSAAGNVQIVYDGYNLVADRVTYFQSSGRVIASGGVEIVEPNGNRVFADEIDVTDDFQDGFVSALRVETPERTRFAAESAERREGEIAVFNNGVYTACEPCKDDPSKPPLWQIRAKRVTINNVTKTVEYEDARFELFGKPIAYLPYFSHADPSIRRRSGFLMPQVSVADELGMGVKSGYFWALAPNFDITQYATYYTNQGLLAETEWRHRTRNGVYNFRFAGIDQKNPGSFASVPQKIDENVTERYAVMTNGKFDINPRWKFGWNWLWQSDGNFARTYNLADFDQLEVTNQIYLTGLNGKNHFDLQAKKFLVQDNREDQVSIQDPNVVGDPDLYAGLHDLRQEQQARVLPVFDYNLVSETNSAGGQVAFDMNITSINRNKADIANYANADGLIPTPDTGLNERFHGIAGQYTRASAQAEWKASTIAGGALVTTSLSARGDAMFLDTSNLGTEFNPLTSNETIVRGMPAAMLEIRYPLIASDGMASHIFEPIAQIIARPNESHIGLFPNEDAQSFVFDTTNLFERDKFSGFDRVEGGTRANIGFRYSASFTGGSSLDIVAGQSFHLHGRNSFAQRDLVNAGLESGLETARSDYVASADLNTGGGLRMGLAGRFDEKDLSMRRGEVSARYTSPDLTVAGSYVFIAKQPQYALNQDRHEANGSASLKLTDEWRVFGSATYDLQNAALVRHGIGLAYDDSCFSLSVAYNENNDSYNAATVGRSVMFRLGLRTLGEREYEYDLEQNQ